MKISGNNMTGASYGIQKKNYTEKEKESGDSVRLGDKVIPGKSKKADFLSMADKLKQMQVSGEDAEEKEVLFNLMNVTNKPEEAKRNLDFIKEHKNKEKTLKESADEFLEIFNELGKKHTEEAREIFGRISSVECDKERQAEKEVILKLVKTENDLKQGIANFDIVKKYKNEKYTLKAGADEFLEVLNKFGNSNTDEVRELYKRYSPIKDDRERLEVKEVILSLVEKEGSVSQGINNFDFLEKYKSKDKTLRELASEFSELLATFGNSNTRETREIFQRLSTIKCEKEKEETKEIIVSLVNAEDSVSQGISNFDFLEKYKSKDKPMRELVSEFLELLAIFGNSNTRETREIFQRLSTIKCEEEKQEDREIILYLAKEEDSVSQGINNFDFVKQYKNEKYTLKAGADEFLELLKDFGNNNTAEAREVYKRYNPIKDDRERLETKEFILECVEAEDSLNNGIENFDFIKKHKNKDKTLREATTEFLKILSEVGNTNSKEARKKFLKFNSDFSSNSFGITY